MVLHIFSLTIKIELKKKNRKNYTGKVQAEDFMDKNLVSAYTYFLRN
jgi:hypothetical protein